MTYMELVDFKQSYEQTLKSIKYYEYITKQVDKMLNADKVVLQGITYDTDVLAGCFSFDYTKINDKLNKLQNLKRVQEITLEELDVVLASVKIKEL